MALVSNNIIINNFKWALISILALFIFNFQDLLICSEILLFNESKYEFELYVSPLTYNKNGQLIYLIKSDLDTVISTNNGTSNKWFRIKSKSSSYFKDFLIGKYPKAINIYSSDSISIEYINKDEIRSFNDSIIYLSNENYNFNEFYNCINAANEFTDSLDCFLRYSEFLSPRKISSFTSRHLFKIYNSGVLLDTNISLKTRELMVASMITYNLAKSSKLAESNVRKIFDMIKNNSEELFDSLLSNNDINYMYNNLEFYDRMIDFIDSMDIKIDTNQNNLFYFTASWCSYCIQDLKKISKNNYKLDNIKIIIVAMEDDNRGKQKMSDFINRLNFKINLYFLDGGMSAKENNSLGVYAVPQIYLFGTRETSKQINVILSEYLKELENQ